VAKELNIKVVVDGEKEEITITDNGGNHVSLKSMMVIGGGFEDQAFYCVSAGSHSDLGWALGKMWRYAQMSKRPEEGAMRKAFNQFMIWIGTYLGMHHGESIDPKVLLERWAKEDRERAEGEAKGVKYLM
jgi:hypothetical protein